MRLCYNKNMIKRAPREGFTLVELSLSMAFIGVLSVAIVLIIADTLSSYRRGMTLNQINTTGMDLVDDMRAALQNSSNRSVLNDCYRYYHNSKSGTDGKTDAERKCEENGAYKLVSLTKKLNEMYIYKDTAGEEKLENVPLYGAFCTGAYSYIWNTGYYSTEYSTLFEEKKREWATFTFKYGDKKVKIVGSLENYYDRDGNLDMGKCQYNGSVCEIGNSEKPFRLLKIRDTRRAVCVSSMYDSTSKRYIYEKNIDQNLDRNFDITKEINNTGTAIGRFGSMSESPIDLILEDKDNDLALYSFDVAEPAESSTQKNTFYSMSFILGTMQGGVNIMANGKSCKVPTDYAVENFDYCAINKFNFAVQTGGEG